MREKFQVQRLSYSVVGSDQRETIEVVGVGNVIFAIDPDGRFQGIQVWLGPETHLERLSGYDKDERVEGLKTALIASLEGQTRIFRLNPKPGEFNFLPRDCSKVTVKKEMEQLLSKLTD